MSILSLLPSPTFLLEPANLAGLVALGSSVTWPLLRRRKAILIVQVAGSLLFGLHYLLLGASTGVTAFTAPAVGDFGYDIYDIVVNQILNGPIGFIGGVALIVFGATKIMTNWMLTILCIIAGTILIRAADLVVTLGAMI